jgi:hypothetical protein
LQKHSFWITVVTIIIAAALVSGCGSKDNNPSGGSVLFQVTRDFGRVEIFSDWVEVAPGESALEVLQKHLNVQTEHGGRFVTAIAGLSSQAAGKYRDDWFFYTNGITAAVGGADYYPREGDIIWWDYHPWGDLYFTPAVTGAFPQPFISGYRGHNPGTVILTTPAGQKSAVLLKNYLVEAGVAQVAVKAYDTDHVKDPREITIVIALWPELFEDPFWQGMQANRQKIGWFARLDPSGFTALDLLEEQEETYSHQVGAILTSGSGLGDATPLWLITSLDEASLENTVAIFLKDPKLLQGTFGVLITGAEVIALPLQGGG